MKISIIIPVYNAERYLCKSIGSVQKQTYRDWEMFLIDDGSTDSSGDICDHFSKEDNRIHVIHQQNCGAGAARNAGIERATGKYVVFLDADDYIEPCYFSKLSSHTEEVIFIDVQLVNESGNILRKEPMSVYSKLSKDELIRNQMTGLLPWGGVYKAVDAQMIKSGEGIKYSNHKIGEEALFSFQILKRATSWGFIDTSVYSYVDHADSLSHAAIDDHWGPVALSLRELIKASGEYALYANTLNAFIQTAAAVRADKIVRNHSISECYSALIDARLWMIKERDNSYEVDRNHMSLKARFMVFCLNHKLYLVIWIISKMRQLIS